jgi:hypothetical protein
MLEPAHVREQARERRAGRGAELLLSGVEHESCPEAVAEPVRKVAQAAEVFAADGLRGLDLDADHSAGRMLQHHVYFHLLAVTVVEELDGLFGPRKLSGCFADREVPAAVRLG